MEEGCTVDDPEKRAEPLWAEKDNSNSRGILTDPSQAAE